MSEKNSKLVTVRTGFTLQQFVLIIATFFMGAICATVVNQTFVEKEFGPASAIASQENITP